MIYILERNLFKSIILTFLRGIKKIHLFLKSTYKLFTGKMLIKIYFTFRNKKHNIYIISCECKNKLLTQFLEKINLKTKVVLPKRK